MHLNPAFVYLFRLQVSLPRVCFLGSLQFSKCPTSFLYPRLFPQETSLPWVEVTAFAWSLTSRLGRLVRKTHLASIGVGA